MVGLGCKAEVVGETVADVGSMRGEVVQQFAQIAFFYYFLADCGVDVEIAT